PLAQPRRAKADGPGQVRDRLAARLRLGGGGHPVASARPPFRRAAQPGVRPGAAGRADGVAAGVRAARAAAAAAAQVRLGPEGPRRVTPTPRRSPTVLTASL